MSPRLSPILALLLASAGVSPFCSARPLGSVRFRIADESGAPHAAICELRGSTSVVRRDLAASDGICEFQQLPPDRYRFRVMSVGFRPAEDQISVEGNVVDEPIVLRLFAPSTTVEVAAPSSDTPLTNAQAITRSALDRRPPSQPVREIIDVVRQQPGWALEANGVLHPRGSEYDMQYIVDGVPILENRSPSFAPPLNLSAVAEMEVQTGGYPASEGRKLGGVVTVHTSDHLPEGFHGTVDAAVGSFNTDQFAFAAGVARPASSLWFDAEGSQTNRFLDPPALENFNNRGDSTDGGIGFSRVFSQYKRIRFSLRGGRSGFDVPNELQQEVAGQRQQRTLSDFSAEVWYQQVLSADWVLDLHGSSRSLSALLDSNSSSTPILPQQNRGLNQQYGAASLAGHHGRNDFSTGIDFIRLALREDFSYSITDASQFDSDLLPQFSFAQTAAGYQASGYAQDQISAGPFTLNAGARWDYYDLLIRRTAWSPRVAAAYRFKPLGIVFRASYDRVFDTPPTENLLLASSPQTHEVNPYVLGLPLEPESGNLFELGAHKTFWSVVQLDVSAYRRDFRNYQDDDVFLNTGVSFPIAFSSALLEGLEAKIHVPLAHRISADTSFANLSGKAWLPVTGGLFLDGGAQLLASNQVFRVSQDQRSTASWDFVFTATGRLHFTCNGWYGSGMPVEVDPGDSYTTDPRILQRVDFARGRLRPSLALGLYGSAQLWKHERQSAEMLLGIDNLTNHLNVIDFAGLFSGTAIGAPRSLHARLRYTF